MQPQEIAALIDNSPMNRGMIGARWVEDPLHISKTIAGNTMLFELEPEGLVHFHWLDTKTPGRAAIDATREAMLQVLDETNAGTIYGLVPAFRKDSALMARWIGARYCGDIETDKGRCQIFIITREILEGTKQ